ncbi:MAG TPA: malto-oligosyltrehalose synthase [Pseudoxanthomonas sp.]|nr:malto-oligosyltrehalose synthase [Pseudoxanthomonas sp.]
MTPVPNPPRATARLQFHADFTLDHAVAIVPYLASLGISHVYASPLLAARSGSNHGYDVTDPTRINPAVGGLPALRRLASALRAHGMGLVLDIVPNHMAASVENPWWRDVLEWGQDSPYADFFDIDWTFPDPKLRGRVLVPTLPRPRDELLADGEVGLEFGPGTAETGSEDRETARIQVGIAGQRFPLAANAYAEVLGGSEALQASVDRFASATPGASFEHALRELGEAAENADGREAIDSALARYWASTAEGRQRLNALLAGQPYLLAPWSQAWHRINWRRFFDVTDLIAIRPDRPGVFDAVHACVLELYAEGLIDGLRIDHIDGLIDPQGYCRQLRERLRALESRRPADAPAGPAYLIVEKILAPGEKLRQDWDVDGTTGYEFMDQVGALLHDPAGEAPLRVLWESLAGAHPYAAHVLDARRQMTLENFAADLDATVRAIRALAHQDDEADSGIASLRAALVELIVHFPVYRTYAEASGADRLDIRVLQQAALAAQGSGADIDPEAMGLLLRWLSGDAPEEAQEEAARVIRRFQRLTPPIAAKAIEDTTFYRYGRLLSRNEVGAEPDHFSMSPKEFHAACAQRQRSHPHSLLATATHDHKRGEDARARLAVLSEIPDRWERHLRQWQGLFAGDADGDRSQAPDPVDESMLYQSLVGAWPLDLDTSDTEALEALRERLSQWQQKALREAKRHSSWAEPNDRYEAACQERLRRCLWPQEGAGFLASFESLVRVIAPAGALNSLVQTLLRLTVPGVPDLYQGTEFWDFSLVDPDNRRPVDYARREAALHASADLPALLGQWKDGRIKQHLIAALLNARREHPALFADGGHTPLEPSGAHAGRAIAFLREHEGQALAVLAPRLAWPLLDAQAETPQVLPERWADTALPLPPGAWRDVISGRTHEVEEARGPLPLRELLADFPVTALLRVTGS